MFGYIRPAHIYHIKSHHRRHEALGWMSADSSRDQLAETAFQGLISYTVAVPNTDIYQKLVEEAINETVKMFNFNPGKEVLQWLFVL